MIKNPMIGRLIPVMVFSFFMFQANAQVPQLANPNATQKAKDVYSYIYNLKGQGLMTGQHNYSRAWSPHNAGIRATNAVESAIGQTPGLWGSDFSYTDPEYSIAQLQEARRSMINVGKAQADAGSVITLTYHMVTPKLEENAGWSNVQKATLTEAEYLELVTPGTTLYNNWKRNMDRIIPFLQELQDEHYAVVWRPYHEMNGIFWWGNGEGSRKHFNQLWINTYNYMVNTHGLNNLIWFWSPNHFTSWNNNRVPDPWFPGHEYVDMLGIDDYYWSQSGFLSQGDYDYLVNKAQGKPLAIGEGYNVNMVLPGVDWMMEHRPEYRWFMIWDGMWIDDRLNDPEKRAALTAIYNHEKAINQEDVSIPNSGDSGDGGDSGCGGTPSQNLILNPGFESDLQSWTVTKGDVVITTTDAQNGNKAMRIGSSAWSWVQQNLEAYEPGATYTFSAWGKVLAAGNRVDVAIKNGSTTIETLSFTSTTYELLSAEVVIPANTTWLQVFVTNRSSGSGVIDDIALYQGEPVVSVTEVSVSPSSAVMEVGGTAQLLAVVSPSDATNQNIIWSSSNPVIASVNSTGLVAALADGSATITATSEDGSISATSSITVSTPDPESFVSVNDTEFTFSGTWNTSTGSGKYMNDDHYSSSTGAYYEYPFYGTQVRIYGSLAAHHGMANVSLNGESAVPVDLYASVRQDEQLIWTSPELPQGHHAIRVSVSGQKNSASTGYTIMADRLDIYNETADSPGDGGSVSDNLILNPGFESDLQSWTVTKGDVVITTADAQNGDKALRIGSSAWSWLQQNLEGYEPGATYTFSAWGKVLAAGNRVDVAIKNGSTTIETLSFTSTSYEQLSAEVVIPANTTWLQVFVTNRSSGTGFVDDIHLSVDSSLKNSSFEGAVSSMSNQAEIRVWVADGKLFINNAAGYQLNLVSVSGALLVNQKIPDSQYSLELSGLAKGVCIVHMASAENVVTKKIVNP